MRLGKSGNETRRVGTRLGESGNETRGSGNETRGVWE